MNRSFRLAVRLSAWLLAAGLAGGFVSRSISSASASPQNAPVPGEQPTQAPNTRVETTTTTTGTTTKTTTVETVLVAPTTPPAPTATPTAAPEPIFRRYMDPAVPHQRAAIDLYERLKENPNDAGLHNDLGALIARDGFGKDALHEFDTAAKLAPKDSRPLFNAGLVHAWNEDWGSARSAFHSATKRDRGNWPAWWMQGFAEEQLGDTSSAIASYKTSLRVGTGLFDVTKNPFAARTRLKARVLLETYDKRISTTAMPWTGEFVYPDKLAVYFQRAAPPVLAAGPLPTPSLTEAAPIQQSGPIVTSAPAPGSGGPARTGSGAVPTFRSVPPRTGAETQGTSRRRRGADVVAPQVDSPPGETAEPSAAPQANEPGNVTPPGGVQLTPESTDTAPGPGAPPPRPRGRQVPVPVPPGPTPTFGPGPGLR